MKIAQTGTIKITLVIVAALLVAATFLLVKMQSTNVNTRSTDCSGCGGCTYEKRSVEAYLSYYELEGDSVTFVSFKPIYPQSSPAWNGKKKTWVSLDRYQLKNMDFKFSSENIDDTTITYLIRGSFIKKGTCSPATVHKVKRILE